MLFSRPTAFAVSLLALLLFPIPPSLGAGPEDAPYVAGEVLMKFRDGASKAQKDAVLAALESELLRSFKHTGIQHRRIAGLTVAEAVERFAEDPSIEFIEPNLTFEIEAMPDDTGFGDLWGLHNNGQDGGLVDADIDAPEAWESFTGSGSVIIGLIDTGVDYLHPDLTANIWTNPGEIPGNEIDDDGNGYVDDVHGYDFGSDDSDPMDTYGHGTHCAGTLGGVGDNGIGVTGVNWETRIMCLKVEAYSRVVLSAVLGAIEYATDHGARLTSNSWGGSTYSESLRLAIEAAGQADVLFVAAAGNSASNTDFVSHYPSGFDLDCIVSVAATDRYDQLAYFSSYGAVTVDLGAPGQDILSTIPGNQYAIKSGTSMATPHAAGALAFVLARFPGMTGLDAKDLILRSTDPLTSLDGAVLTGGRLNLANAVVDPDTTPPGAISDLAVATARSDRLDLTWTAPGDDGNNGIARRYDVRYSTLPIDESNWSAAIPAAGAPAPAPSGSPQSFTVEGLEFETTYHVAVRSQDELGNLSALSNVVAAATLGAPALSVVETSFSEALLTGGTATRTLTLGNVGAGTLEFRIPAPEPTATPILVESALFLPKGETDPRPGHPVTKAAGGPDGSGYRWIDNRDPLGPSYVWMDIAPVGAMALDEGDETVSLPIPIGFGFPFYGEVFEELLVYSNGYLTLGPGPADIRYTNQPLPSTGSPANLVAPFWDDLVLNDGAILYHNDGERLILQWDNVHHWSVDGPYTFQAVLYPTGTIEFYYESIGEPDDSATVGIQNADATVGTEVVFNAPLLQDGLAVRIQQTPQWVTVDPGAGTIWAGDSQALEVRFDAAGLFGGLHEAALRIHHNDPGQPLHEIPVTLVVTGAPVAEVEPLDADLGDVFVNGTAVLPVRISNLGTEPLMIDGVALDDPAFVADAASLTVNPGRSATLGVGFTPTAVQPYAGTLTMTTNDVHHPTIAVAVRGAGVIAPEFNIEPGALASDLQVGQIDTLTFTLTNSGGADFEFDVRAELAERTAGEDAGGGFGALDMGGPDAAGYHWVDSDAPGGPVYDWIDISRSGTQILVADNWDASVEIPIGFAFPYYGTEYSTVHVCSNGFVSFTSASTSSINSLLPASGAPGNLLAVFWEALRVWDAGSERVYFRNDAERLIVQWDHVTREMGKSGDKSGEGDLTFQLILHPDGTFVYQYGPMIDTDVSQATIGFQNGDGSAGLTISYFRSYARDGLAVRVTPHPDWLEIEPDGGVLASGESRAVSVILDGRRLFGGGYDADIIVESNDPVVPQFRLPLHLALTGVPDFSVSATSVDFGEMYISQPAFRTVLLRNTGTDDLTISEAYIDTSAFTQSLILPLVIPAATSIQTDLGCDLQLPGAVQGVLSLASDDPDTPLQQIALAAVGVLPPVARTDPDSLRVALATGAEATRTVTLHNAGGSDLEFQVAPVTGAEKVVVHSFEDSAKGEPDPRIGLLGAGGPDAFGYVWIDSDDPAGPVYDWVEISATGTPVFTSLGEDRNVGPLPIGFEFPFYGELFTTFRVCSNGWLSFTSTENERANQVLPNTGAPANLLAPFWDDLTIDPAAGANVYYEFDGGRLIVQFDRVMTYGSGGPHTFEVILDPGGAFTFQYREMDADYVAYATVGLQNGTMDDGLTVAFNSDYPHDGLAIRFSAANEWLAVAPLSGTIAAGGSQTLDVALDATGLFGGDYPGRLRILSNDPVRDLLNLPVLLDVSGVPTLAPGAAELDFGVVYLGHERRMELEIVNTGTDLLSVISVQTSDAVYGVEPSGFQLAPLARATVTVTCTPTSAGTVAADLVFESNDPASPTVVDLGARALPPPILSVSPDTLHATALPGGLKTKTVTLSNTGASDLSWSVENEQNKSVETALAAGGMDSFGNSWMDSDEPGGPVYQWNDIAAIGTPVFGAYASNQNLGPFPIGFEFPFYGAAFDQFRVCSNGFLSFTSTSVAYTNRALPTVAAAENLLAVFWDDMTVDPAAGGEVYYHFDGEKLIVQFELRRTSSNTTPPYYSMQAILYPNGQIDYLYESLGPILNSATIGIQNAVRNDALLINYNTTYVHEGLAVRISPPPDWLTSSPSSGVIAAGESAQVLITLDAARFEAGDYPGALVFSSNDPATPLASVDVLLHVAAVPAAWTEVELETSSLQDGGKWMTVRAELPPGYAAADVLPATIALNGVVPADSAGFDATGDFDQNGTPDLAMRFDRTLLEAVLAQGEQVEITVAGEVLDTAWFVAKDTLRIARPTLTFPNDGQLLPYDFDVAVRWTDPAGVLVNHADVAFSLDGGAVWQIAAAGVSGNEAVWHTPSLPTTDVLVRVFVYDAEGLVGYDTCDESLTLDPDVTAVPGAMPAVYALQQNHPNPFNPMTTIRFDLPRPGRTRLAIYDVRGRLVRELVSTHLEAGSHEVVWRGRDSGGRQVASGVYYYRIRSGDYREVRSMVLLK